LVTNLGLSSVAGLANWVAAQLTAAGAANKGAKIVSLLNDFAGMTADATYGAQATAFNTKVDAALAASQKTGAASGVFADAGTVAVANATFTLTTGVDTGAAFTGGAGNDVYNATVATMNTLDSVDAGAGVDTLSINETASVASLPGTYTNFETLSISTTGSIGSITATASTPAAAVAQVSTITVGVASASQKYDVTVGGVKYTTAAVAGATTESAYTVISNLLASLIGDGVTIGSVSAEAGSGTTATRTFTLTSKVAGTPLPSITLANSTTTPTATGTVSLAATTANTVGTANTAVAQTEYITLTNNPSAGDTYTLVVNGTTYTANYSPTSPTTTTGAADIAASLNAILGAGTATSSNAVVTVKALVAGTPLPVINLTSSGATTDAWAQGIANYAATAAASSAAAVAAPTGITSYTAAATGVANVSGAKTTDITASGTAVQTSSGNIVKVTASDSVFVSSAVGPVTISTGTTSTTLIGAVAADTSTGTAGDAAGVYVTGGTTVGITGSKTTTDVKVGAAPYAKAAVNTTGYPETNGNVAKTPTGDVTITKVTPSTSTTTGVVTGTYGVGTAKVYTNGGTTVTVKGSGTTTITDSNTFGLKASADSVSAPSASKLATVNLAGLSGTATVLSDAITTINLSDTLTAQTVTISNSGVLNANSGAINFNVSNAGLTSARVTLDDSTATSVNVGTLAASAYGKVATGTSTAVDTNTGSRSFITLNTPKATSLTMTNALAVDIGSIAGAGSTGTAKIASVNGSAATGAITTTIGTTSEYGMAFTGGAGADTVTLTGDVSAHATTGKVTSVSLGAGNDKVLNSTASAATTTFTGATFDGGEGNDTVALSLLTVGNASKFTNFETLGLDIATAGTRDVTIIGGMTGLSLLANSTGTVNYTGVTVAQPLTIGATQTNALGVTNLDFGTTVLGTSDAYTISMAGTGASSATAASPTSISAGVIKVEGIEALTLSSGGSGFVNNTIALTDTKARTLTITGSQKTGVTFSGQFGTDGTDITSNGVSLIDASSLTGKLTLNTAGIQTAYAGLTINGGTSDDTITLTAQSDGLGRISVNAGAGNDTITTSTKATTLTGGTGNDYFDVTNTVVGSTLTSPIFTTITDFQAGDTIKMGQTSVVVSGKAAVINATSLSNALDTALWSAGVTSGVAVWFVYGGDTYVAVENSTDGLDSGDIVVKLSGSIETLNWSSGTSGLIGAA